MRLFRIGRSSSAKTAAAAAAAAADGDRPASPAIAAAVGSKNADGGCGPLVMASPDHNGTENGSKDESFFEARPWLDSDSEDDFHSVRGDFTPSRGSTPDHQRQTSFTARLTMEKLKPSLVDKKQRLLELLQEKQQYDDEHDNITDAGSEMENSSVHAEEQLKSSSAKGEKAKKPSKSGCFPSSIWKLSFKSCRRKKKEQKDK